jgi:RsiW-degrading membrane proteinase PrsW (M82 family)
MPARLLWLLFPALLALWFLFDRDRFWQQWQPTAVTLFTGLLISAPLFLYLQFLHPTAETRLDQLRGPLDAFLAGNRLPLFSNIWYGARILIMGRG